MKLPPLDGIHATYCRCQLHHRTLDSAFAEVKNSIVVLRGSGAVVKVLVGQSLRAESERVAVVRPECPLRRHELERGDPPYGGPLLELQGQGPASVGGENTGFRGQ